MMIIKMVMLVLVMMTEKLTLTLVVANLADT